MLPNIMHCNFLVFSIVLKAETYMFRFDVIKPYEVGSTGHYIRYEGTSNWPFKNPRGVILDVIPNIDTEPMVFKFCTKEKATLAFLDNPDEATTSRKDDNVDDPNDQDSSHAMCTEIINKRPKTKILNISAINKNILPPCTVKMLVRDISYRRARAYGTYQQYSHQGTAAIALRWDQFIPSEELMDHMSSMITMRKDGKIKELFYIAGFLKLVTHTRSERIYTITPALGDPPGNEIYEFLDDYCELRKMTANVV